MIPLDSYSYMQAFTKSLFTLPFRPLLFQVGLTVVNNQLIAIGGFDGATYLKTVELYDPDANCWLLGGSMNSRRLGGGVGVVRLANASWNLSLNNSPLGLRDDPSSGDLTRNQVFQYEQRS